MSERPTRPPTRILVAPKIAPGTVPTFPGTQLPTRAWLPPSAKRMASCCSMFGAMSTPTLVAGHYSAHERDDVDKNGFSNHASGSRPSLARFLLGLAQVRASAAAEADPGRDRRIASGPHSRTSSLVASSIVKMCRRYRTANCSHWRRKASRIAYRRHARQPS
jgi:hypothetical protein